MSEEAPDEFYGELWRTRFESDRATLRFYPFAFDPDAGRCPVYEVMFDRPAFGLADIERFLNQEVEFSKSSNAATIHGVFSGDKVELIALSVTSNWQAYDIEDYIARVKQLDSLYSQLHEDLSSARNKLGKVHSTTIELLRRAEIKASTSPELHKMQVSALEVLNRILFELE